MSDTEVDEASEPAPPEADQAKKGVPRDPSRAVGASAQVEPKPPSFVVATLTRQGRPARRFAPCAVSVRSAVFDAVDFNDDGPTRFDDLELARRSLGRS